MQMNDFERSKRMKMSWLLAIVLIFLVTSSTVMETEAGEPSVYYTKSSWGNFFMAPHMTINSTEASHVLTKDLNNCTCRSACATVPSCKAWSLVKTDNGTTECRLASEGPLKVIPVNDSDATYFFREDSVAGMYSFQGDKLFYVQLTKKMSYNEGKKACENIPGHRMMIIKTELQYQYFKSLWDSHKTYFVVVDLKKVIIGPTTLHIWGDETLYNETELDPSLVIDNGLPASDIYVNYYGKFNDDPRTKLKSIYCQANPLGVDW